MDELTPYQHTIAALIAEGRTDAEIAERLALTPETVTTIREEMGLNTKGIMR